MDFKIEYSRELHELPIYSHLEKIVQTLKNSKSRFLVLTAQTAAGKSTAVPIALLRHFPSKIYMLEPRRLAVISIANRLSELLQEKPGQTVGYRIQLENKIGRDTRLEITTEGILTRRLQEDPLLEGVSVVVLDEFHERSVHSDLALAFLKEAMQIRDDLYVIVMSATMDAKNVSEYLGGSNTPCPIFNVEGRQFPVQIEYKNISVEKAVFEELRQIQKGRAILVFLPGIYEIRRLYETLQENFSEDSYIQTFMLHSSIGIDEQKKLLSQVPKDSVRIVISSSIAETSITVPGVYTVIDSGLSRLNRMNVSLGMEKLVTEAESLFSAEQRSGRAGRLGPGKCVRLWNKNEVRQVSTQPEILRADISSLVLECANRQVLRPEYLDWLTPPGEAAWNAAVQLLELLLCIKDGKITELGRAVAGLGISPRLGCVAFSREFETVLKFSDYAKSSPEIQKKFIEKIKQRVESSGFVKQIDKNAGHCANGLLAGFPDRLARLENGLYKFPSGRVAGLTKSDAERYAVLPEWIVAPEVDAGETSGRIYSWQAVEYSEISEWMQERANTKIETYFSGNKIQKNQTTCFGKIVLSSKKLPVSPDDYAAALCSEVKQKGFKVLPSSQKIQEFLTRAEFFEQQGGDLGGKSDTQKLCENPDEWLLPFLAGKTSVTEKQVYDALYWFLNGTEIDRNAPEFITLSNGKRRRLAYESQSLSDDHTRRAIRPVLEIIIQQIFGCLESPKIMGMSVLLKLLSPARRPLQITDDLEGFWHGTWTEICREMKGRYPKHNWDYRISEDD